MCQPGVFPTRRLVSGHCVLVPSGRGGARLSVLLVPMQTCHELLVHVRCCRILAAELLDGFAAAPKPPDVSPTPAIVLPISRLAFSTRRSAVRWGYGRTYLTNELRNIYSDVPSPCCSSAPQHAEVVSRHGGCLRRRPRVLPLSRGQESSSSPIAGGVPDTAAASGTGRGSVHYPPIPQFIAFVDLGRWPRPRHGGTSGAGRGCVSPLDCKCILAQA